MNDTQTQSPENIFKQKITTTAYDYIRTTYPDLVPYIITLKLEDIDIDKGTAAAVFIIKKGNDIAYIPVIIADNSVLSCEVIYYKNENRFFPLIGKEISRIVNINNVVPSSLVKSPNINTTYNFFRNMYRPPITERIALASDDTDMLTNLPNKYKEAVYNTIKSDTELLKKIAEFYPIEELVNKLSIKTNIEDNLGIPKLASTDDINTVVTADDLDDKSYKYLTKEAAEDITTYGYHIMSKTAYDTDAILDKDVTKNIILSSNIRELTLDSTRQGITCDVYVAIYGTLQLLMNAIIADNNIYHATGVYHTIDSNGNHTDYSGENIHITVKEATEGIDQTLFIEYGARYILPFFKKLISSKLRDVCKIGVFIPNKYGRYTHVTACSRNHYHRKDHIIEIHVDSEHLSLMEDIDGSVTIKVSDYYALHDINYIKVVDTLTHSSILEGNTLYVPASALVMPKINKIMAESKVAQLLSITQVIKHIKRQLPKHTLITDGKEYHLKDTAGNIKSFKKEAALANFMHNSLDISPENIHTIVKEAKDNSINNSATNFFLIEKNAAEFNLSNGNPQGIIQQNLGLQSSNPDTMAYKPNMGNPNLMGQGLPPVVDSNTLSIYANGFNKTIMDIGVLSSLYSNEDIKTYLLDYVPQFVETVSNLGKIILLFNLNKEQLIGKYGTGEYHSIISTLRKIFKSLAEIIIDLERYVGTLATLPADKQHTKGLHSTNKAIQASSI